MQPAYRQSASRKHAENGKTKMAAAANTLTIDATALDGINFNTYIADYFTGLQAKSAQYFGGTPDVTQMGTFYVNGTQVLNRYDVAGSDPLTLSAKVLIVGGTEIAYDYMHHGTTFGHGISGFADSLTFGNWIDGTTTGTRGTGASGEIAGLDTGLTITGFNLTAAPGAGTDPATNLVQALYSGARNLDAALIYSLIDDYSLAFNGSAGADTVNGFAFDDQLRGNAGDDVLRGFGGDDSSVGGSGADSLTGGQGNDSLWGQGGKDMLNGGAGDDMLHGGFGADRLVGGAGADTFAFQKKGGIDTVVDFGIGVDKLDVSALGVASLDDFKIVETKKYVQLSAEGTTIRLLGVDADDLVAGDFLF
jgi:Ca2+-binding RTX toxin-like protein